MKVINDSALSYIWTKLKNYFVHDASYVHTDNNFTSTLKDKLDGIASGAEVNVQSDWNQTNTSADDYIKNKPESFDVDATSIPTADKVAKFDSNSHMNSADMTSAELEIYLEGFANDARPPIQFKIVSRTVTSHAPGREYWTLDNSYFPPKTGYTRMPISLHTSNHFIGIQGTAITSNNYVEVISYNYSSAASVKFTCALVYVRDDLAWT